MQIKQKQIFKFTSLAFILLFVGCQSSLQSHARMPWDKPEGQECAEFFLVWCTKYEPIQPPPPRPIPQPINQLPLENTVSQQKVPSLTKSPNQKTQSSPPIGVRRTKTTDKNNNAPPRKVVSTKQSLPPNSPTASSSNIGITSPSIQPTRPVSPQRTPYENCILGGGGRVDYGKGVNDCVGKKGTPEVLIAAKEKLFPKDNSPLENPNNPIIISTRNTSTLQQKKKLPDGIIKNPYGTYTACGEGFFSTLDEAAEYVKEHCANKATKKKVTTCGRFGGIASTCFGDENEENKNSNARKDDESGSRKINPAELTDNNVVNDNGPQSIGERAGSNTGTNLGNQVINSQKTSSGSGVSDSMKEHVEKIRRIDPTGNYSLPE